MANNKKFNLFGVLDDLLMIFLSLLSGYFLFIELTTNLLFEQIQLIDSIDFFIACMFLLDFVIRFSFSESRKDFFKHNWWYLLASIPVTNTATQALRLLRFLRIIKIVRLIPGIKKILDYIDRLIKQTHILYVLSIWLLIVFFGTITFYIFEYTVNIHVKNLFDSLWYVVSTITTVGYGDIYPMTTAGRIVGMILMLTGIGTSGIVTALVASFFIKNKE